MCQFATKQQLCEESEVAVLTVPSMRRKGRPTVVCQFCGDFSIRLLIVSRIVVFWPAYASGKWSVHTRELRWSAS